MYSPPFANEYDMKSTIICVPEFREWWNEPSSAPDKPTGARPAAVRAAAVAVASLATRRRDSQDGEDVGGARGRSRGRARGRVG